MINYFRIRLLIVLGWITIPTAFAQDQVLTINDSYELARRNYPLIKQFELIRKTEDFSVENAAKGYLPQVSVLGQATYQSAVTEFKLPIAIPGAEFPSISKDQYKVYAEVNQTIYDGGAVRTQIESQKQSALVEAQRVEVEVYKLNERVNQLFFGVLMLDEQLKQNELLKKDIDLGIRKIQAFIDNGTAFKSNGNTLKAELLKTQQRAIELASNRKAYLDMLGLLIGQDLAESTVLAKPETLSLTGEISRPELRLLDYQRQNLDIQDQLLKVKNRPKLNFFFQGGYGRPALNILNNGFDPYYMTGVRLNWSLSGLYTAKNNRALIANNRESIQVQQALFLYNTNLSLKQQNADLIKLQKLLESDDEIIALRESVKTTAAAQLENGVINTNDYLREVNAEDQARLNRILHEIQLLMSNYNVRTTRGQNIDQ
ncbi:TolC family protein [Dyadobacter fanqingshengii]|uniref:TolC family protein n=1 Tax=Dyadobacter fanqingshengii TaxID=2906443 RepID=A0A9X1T887_9BACT|nr:TolC family protein [Dyadobacter fanqingshengii]MCF0039935.1 TolC family protein [Dyadobacter fanqingshengii]USJ38307.1 TolC family protein [Dyadobacter fanqingshengii]